MLLHHANTNGKKLNQNMKVTLKNYTFIIKTTLDCAQNQSQLIQSMLQK